MGGEAAGGGSDENSRIEVIFLGLYSCSMLVSFV